MLRASHASPRGFPEDSSEIRGTLASVGSVDPAETPARPDAEPSAGRAAPLPSERLDRALIGKLPCVVCAYDLQGLSIRTVCPECGTAIRATILYQVDPRADEFRPMLTPRLTAWAIVVWSAGALLAAVACWLPRVADLIGLFALTRPSVDGAGYVAVGACAASGLALIGLVHPAAGTPRRQGLAAVVAMLAYAPLCWALWRINLQIDPRHLMPYFAEPIRFDRALLRLVIAASTIVIILAIRPNARDLVKRCLVLRTGRVDRQTLLVMAATMGVVSMGDALRVASAWINEAEAGLVGLTGIAVIALGSGLFTLGLVGALVDSWRISRSILMPSPSLRRVLGPPG